MNFSYVQQPFPSLRRDLADEEQVKIRLSVPKAQGTSRRQMNTQAPHPNGSGCAAVAKLQDMALHPNSRKHASFSSLKVVIPNPPFFFRRQTCLQLTKFILSRFSDPDQRKFFISLPIEQHMLLGIGRIITIWRGMPPRTCLIRIILPTNNREFAFQPANLLLKLERRFSQWTFLGQPINRGLPRYFHGKEPVLNLKIGLIWQCTLDCIYQRRESS